MDFINFNCFSFVSGRIRYTSTSYVNQTCSIAFKSTLQLHSNKFSRSFLCDAVYYSAEGSNHVYSIIYPLMEFRDLLKLDTTCKLPMNICVYISPETEADIQITTKS